MREYNNGIDKGINGSTLKIIAVICMIIDHIGRAFWYRLPDMGYLMPDFMTWEKWHFFYLCMRYIGRTSFPIFCFLLVEGFWNTSNRRRYGVRLLLFAFLSQLPYHYAFLGLETGSNVMFTLFIGLLVIWGMNTMEHRVTVWYLAWGGKLLLLMAGGYFAVWLDSDYTWKGILLIGVFYLLREQRVLALFSGYLVMIESLFCFPAFLMMYFYNRKRGMRLKYLFYLIYPLHLSVLYVMWKYLP